MPDCSDVKSTRGYFSAFLDLVKQNMKIDPSDIMLMGFSQGGSVAIDNGVYGTRVGEITAVQGFIAQGEKTAISKNANPNVTINFLYSRDDSIIPKHISEASISVLNFSDHNVRPKEFAGNHIGHTDKNDVQHGVQPMSDHIKHVVRNFAKQPTYQERAAAARRKEERRKQQQKQQEEQQKKLQANDGGF